MRRTVQQDVHFYRWCPSCIIIPAGAQRQAVPRDQQPRRGATRRAHADIRTWRNDALSISRVLSLAEKPGNRHVVSSVVAKRSEDAGQRRSGTSSHRLSRSVPVPCCYGRCTLDVARASWPRQALRSVQSMCGQSPQCRSYFA